MTRHAKHKAAVKAGIAATRRHRNWLRYASRHLPWVERVDRRLGLVFCRNVPGPFVLSRVDDSVFFQRRMVLQLHGVDS